MTTSDALVVDASIAVKWVVSEELEGLASALFEDARAAGITLVTPPHFRFEVTNAVWRKLARGLLSAGEADTALTDFREFATQTVSPPELARHAFELAKQLRPAAIYDLLYVALAQVVGCALWTADNRLANAVAGVPVRVELLSEYAPRAT